MRLFRHIDRILLDVPEVGAWLHFFTQELELPEAWPLSVTSGGAVTAGVYLGAVSLELSSSPRGLLGRPPSGAPALAGIAFASGVDLEDLPVILSTYSIDCHFDETLPLAAVGMPTLVIEGLMSGSARLFVAHHGYDTEPWQRHLQQAFAFARGGALGISGTAAVVVGLPDAERRQGQWQRLRPGNDTTHNELQFDSGPALRFVPHVSDQLLAIELEVRSVAVAMAVLQNCALPPGAELHGCGWAAGSVDIRLVQRS